MNETTSQLEGAGEAGSVLPDVTRIALLSLDARGDRVLDSAIRRLIADVVNEQDSTAGFGSYPATAT